MSNSNYFKSLSYAETLLTRDQVISEVVRLATNLEVTKDDFNWFYGATAEVINDPCDTLNHRLPKSVTSDDTGNKLSDYYYLIAQEAAEQV